MLEGTLSVTICQEEHHRGSNCVEWASVGQRMGMGMGIMGKNGYFWQNGNGNSWPSENGNGNGNFQIPILNTHSFVHKSCSSSTFHGILLNE